MKGRPASIAILTLGFACGAGLALLVATRGTSGLADTPLGRWLGRPPAPAIPANGITPAQPGQVVGPLPLTDLDHQPQALPSNRRVLVNLWAGWCAPCRQEMPLLAHYAATQDGQGVAVVGIAEDDAAYVADFLRKSPAGYQTLLDDAQWRASTRLGNARGLLPFTALIDANGRLLKTRTGPFDSAEAVAQWAAEKN